MGKKISPDFAMAMIILIAGVIGTLLWLGNQKEKQEDAALTSVFEKPGPEKNQKMAAESTGAADVAERTIGVPEQDIKNSSEEDGEEAVGYFKDTYGKNGKNYLTIDYVEWLEGKTALKAKIEDGGCLMEVKNRAGLLREVDSMDMESPPEKFISCVPLEYYIRNRNSRLRSFEIAQKAKITRTTVFDAERSGEEGKTISLSEFMSAFKNDSYQFRSLPFRVKITNNIVTEIDQIYLP